MPIPGRRGIHTRQRASIETPGSGLEPEYAGFGNRGITVMLLPGDLLLYIGIRHRVQPEIWIVFSVACAVSFILLSDRNRGRGGVHGLTVLRSRIPPHGIRSITLSVPAFPAFRHATLDQCFM